ncbi:MAG: tetratricopeptide repeat protein [bacterium]
MSENTFEQLVQQGDAFATQGQWDSAVEEYRKALEVNPQSSDVRRNLTQMFLKKGDFEQAIREYFLWAQTCQAAGDTDEAIRIYQELLNPESMIEKKAFMLDKRAAGVSMAQLKELLAVASGDIFFNLGILFLEKDAIEDSIGCFKRCLQIAPGNARVRSFLGQAYMKKGLDKEAQGEFQEVVRLAPEEAAFAYEMLGELFLRGGKSPQSTLTWFKRAGELYLKKEQTIEAVRVYEKIASIDKKNKDILSLLGDLYATGNEMGKATATFKALAEVHAEDGLLDKVIVLYEKLLGWDPENAEIRESLIEIYRRILEADPSNLSARYKLIGALLRKGSTAEVIPEYLSLAQTLLERNILDEGLSVCQKLIELDTDNVSAHEILAEIHFKLNDHENSLYEFMTVLRLLKENGDEKRIQEIHLHLQEIFPERAEVHFQLARAHIENENWEEAAEELRKVLKEDPGHLAALNHLTELYSLLERPVDALAVDRRIVELEPSNLEVRKRILDYCLEAEDYRGALAEIYSMADILLPEQEWDEIEGLYRLIMEYLPEEMEVRSRLCRLYAARGELNLAQEESVFLLNYHLKRENLPEAAQVCRSLIELDGRDLNARYKLGKIYARQGLVAESVAERSAIADILLEKKLSDQATTILQEILEVEPANVLYRLRLIELLVEGKNLEEAVRHEKILLRHFLRAGNLEEARKVYLNIVSMLPERLELREEIAFLYVEEGALDEGLAILDELLQAYLLQRDTPKIVRQYETMAGICLNNGREEAAWSFREKIADLYQKEGRSQEALQEYLALAEALMSRASFTAADAIFEKVIELFLRDGRAQEAAIRLESMANAFLQDNHHQEAFLIYEKTVELYERDHMWQRAVEILGFMAQQREEAGEREKALEAFSRRSEILLREGEMHSAVEQLFSVIRIHLSTGDSASAESVYEKIREILPDGTDVVFKMSEIYYHFSFFEKALPLYRNILALEPGHSEVLSKLAILSARSGDFQAATESALKVLTRGCISNIFEEYLRISELKAEDPATHLSLGRLYRQMGFAEEAIREFKQISGDQERQLAALNQIGLCLKDDGFPDLAVQQFQKSLELPGYSDEELQDLRYDLGNLYEEMGKKREALGTFQECYAVDIKYRDVSQRIEALGRELEKSGETE